MKFVLLNARSFAAGADLTGQANKVELSCDLEDKNATNYGSQGWGEVLGGLFSTSIDAGGQWEAGDPGRVDDVLWAAMSSRGAVPWTVCPRSANVGELAWHTAGLTTSYKAGGTVGEVAPWESQGKGSGPLLRGTVAHPPGAPRTGAGAGTALQLGAVADGHRLYCNLHVLSVAGTGSPTLTVRVESAPDETFAAATTRATFPAATAREGRDVVVSGPVTDTWWRVAWSITGTGPSFLFLAALGVA